MAVAGKAPAVEDGVAVIDVMVNRSAVRLWFVAGATTVTVRFGLAASSRTSASMPGAFTPSSFVTSTCSGPRAAAARLPHNMTRAGGKVPTPIPHHGDLSGPG